MIAIDGKMDQAIGGTLCAAIFYFILFWRIFKRNPGNRVVECGVITLTVFFVMLLFSKFGNIPDWLFGLWLILVVLLCFSTLFFVVQRASRAFRHRKDA
jgi:phosphoglycerol transferase MdoB-like AlkP superfamily enzyme